MAPRNFCTSGSIFKCRDIVHIFTCRARDKVTFTCTTARKFGHLGKMFSHLTFVSLSFFFCKRCFDESFRFILSRSISVSFLKHPSKNTHRSVKNNVRLSYFGINTLFLPRFHGPVVIVTTCNEYNLGPGIHYIHSRTS